MLYDPICGRKVSAGSSGVICVEYKKRKYYFCSEGCRASFQREAERIRLHELARVGALLSSGKVRWGMA
ncbi:YHS domain-containing protein [Vulgatibacter incomptus]|uniref:TRASH domain-containing protein n=1 Tax=Vulgatibacter incomptus TaxID=1391653 RepID=A0A0K1P9V5_9BACT|nr:YHS domain-containing protein [Vulgatibacter incomptus]AKU89899.1 hypothetical protein AKJ08_0286 [Vulgatibacter incomptus]